MRSGKLVLQQRPGQWAELQADGDVGPSRRRRVCGGARARRHPVRGRCVLEVPRLVRPLVGTREVDHEARARESRVPERKRERLLPVLRSGGRRSGQGLLQLRPRAVGTSSRSTRTARSSAAAASARRRSNGFAPTSPRIRRAARSRTGTTRASRPASTAAIPPTPRSSRRCTTRTPTSSSSATITTTSASRRRTASGTLDLARGIRQFVVGSGGKNVRTFPTRAAEQRGPRRDEPRRPRAHARRERLRVALPRRGRLVHRQRLGQLPLSYRGPGTPLNS